MDIDESGEQDLDETETAELEAHADDLPQPEEPGITQFSMPDGSLDVATTYGSLWNDQEKVTVAWGRRRGVWFAPACLGDTPAQSSFQLACAYSLGNAIDVYDAAGTDIHETQNRYYALALRAGIALKAKPRYAGVIGFPLVVARRAVLDAAAACENSGSEDIAHQLRRMIRAHWYKDLCRAGFPNSRARVGQASRDLYRYANTFYPAGVARPELLDEAIKLGMVTPSAYPNAVLHLLRQAVQVRIWKFANRQFGPDVLDVSR